jgi:DNA-binding IclR family transcriptional regulator
MARGADPYAGLPMVSHCLNVLELVCWGEKPMTVSEIAMRLDLSKSTAHRVLQVMKEHNFVVQKPKGAYRPGPKAHALGSVVLRRSFVADKIEPVMDEIARETNETAVFAVANPEFPGLLVVSERETPHPIRLQSYLGKCISEDVFGVKLDKVNVATREAMPATDYTTSHEDKRIKCISSIVYDKKKQVKGVLALMVPDDRLDTKTTKKFTALIKDKAVFLGDATA